MHKCYYLQQGHSHSELSTHLLLLPHMKMYNHPLINATILYAHHSLLENMRALLILLVLLKSKRHIPLQMLRP